MANSLTVSGRMSSTIVRDEQTQGKTRLWGSCNLVHPPIILQDRAITSAAKTSISGVESNDPTWQDGESGGDMYPLRVPHHLISHRVGHNKSSEMIIKFIQPTAQSAPAQLRRYCRRLWGGSTAPFHASVAVRYTGTLSPIEKRASPRKGGDCSLQFQRTASHGFSRWPESLIPCPSHDLHYLARDVCSGRKWLPICTKNSVCGTDARHFDHVIHCLD
jgi:hypothetical protein